MGLERSGFAVGTGRCGTRFIVSLFDEEPGVASSHERNNFNETFHRYCVWNKLPVDDEGFLLTKQKEISDDLKEHSFSFEASAHLSLSIVPLYNRFKSKFILLVRNPINVVNSYFVGKTWYKIEYHKKNPDLAVGYHDMPPHHFLGRIVPNGEEFLEWKRLTRLGQLAWMWNAINLKVFEQLEQIPKEHSMIIRLEEFDHDKYLEVGDFFGLKLSLTRQQFDTMAGSRAQTAETMRRTVSDWSEKELSDFVEQIRIGVKVFGYDEVVAQDLRKPRGPFSKAVDTISRNLFRKKG